MKKTLSYISLLAIAALLLITPVITSASGNFPVPGPDSGDGGPIDPGNSSGQPADPGNSSDQPPDPGQSSDQLENRASAKLKNPLGSASIKTIIVRVINFFSQLAAIVLTIMILIGAWQLITSGGNPENTKKAKATILWAAVGFGIILIAQGIGAIIKSLFK